MIEIFVRADNKETPIYLCRGPRRDRDTPQNRLASVGDRDCGAILPKACIARVPALRFTRHGVQSGWLLSPSRSVPSAIAVRSFRPDTPQSTGAHYCSSMRLRKSRRNSSGSKRAPRYRTRRMPRRSMINVRNECSRSPCCATAPDRVFRSRPKRTPNPRTESREHLYG
jgi:hypothetical protein